MTFWLFTTQLTRLPGVRITLHRDGCRVMRNPLPDANAWTGPLSWDDIAVVPLDTYAVCGVCHNCREPCRKTLQRPAYGKRRLSSRRRKQTLFPVGTDIATHAVRSDVAA